MATIECNKCGKIIAEFDSEDYYIKRKAVCMECHNNLAMDLRLEQDYNSGED